MCCCPTTVSNVCGLYLRADTTKRSIKNAKYTIYGLMSYDFIIDNLATDCTQLNAKYEIFLFSYLLSLTH